MTARAFKVGDVVVATAEWSRGEVSAAAAQKVNLGWERLGDGAFVRHVLSARPLVLIDPEDDEAVERLIVAYSSQPRWHTGYTRDRVDAMQAALREFAGSPPPKPDEPTGLGAVVRDAEGTPWVRTENRPNISGHVWASAFSTRRPDRSDHAEWSEIDAVEVLSEGVTP